jgi:gamma-glutamylcyclotransferase (GGCT)/AIG2-like uncharacterized protein YtfP
MTQIFVYGTLQPGEVNYGVCADAVLESRPAIVRGQLYHLPLGYPALAVGTRTVGGFLLSFADSSILQRLDELEQHDPIALQALGVASAPHQYDYAREWIAVWQPGGRSLGEAWVYRMAIEHIQKLGGILLSSQQWNGRQVY